jgi:basic membrane protein A and related proteins
MKSPRTLGSETAATFSISRGAGHKTRPGIGTRVAFPLVGRPLSLLLLVVLALCACGKGGGKKSEERFHVGLVFDVGGLGDKSFNDAAYLGLTRAEKELGIQFEYFEPGEGTDREAALRILANGESRLIIGVGFLFTDDIRKVAQEYPDKKFACVDYTWSEGDSIPSNLVGIKFREEEGCYLVGSLAGLITKSGTVGFVGGMDIPLIRKFEAGYRAGFTRTRPGGKVLVNYAGVTGDAFKNPSKGKELALAQLDAGADILFHASGSTGLGVFEAVRDRDKLAIGVDADQADLAPGHVLTSMIKRVEVAVFDVIRRAQSGEFAPGILNEGLKEQGVDYVYNDKNAPLIPDDVHAQVESLRAEIVRGELQVPSR